jgi:hypothetical protein
MGVKPELVLATGSWFPRAILALERAVVLSGDINTLVQAKRSHQDGWCLLFLMNERVCGIEVLVTEDDKGIC